MGAQFTKTAIIGGIVTVNAFSEGVKASTDVNVDIKTGDTKIESIYTGNKSPIKAAVEFVTGILPLPDVTDKSVGDAINAGAQYVTGALKSVLEEGINAQVDDEAKKN